MIFKKARQGLMAFGRRLDERGERFSLGEMGLSQAARNLLS